MSSLAISSNYVTDIFSSKMKNGVYLKISHKGLELFEFPVMGNWNLKGIFSNQDFKRVQTAFCAQKSHIMVQPSMDGSIQKQKIHQC